jgi:hypothetical protein
MAVVMDPDQPSRESGEDSNVIVRVPRTLKRIMDAHVRRDTHMNLSDFVREAIRTKLMAEAPDLYAVIVRGETARD